MSSPDRHHPLGTQVVTRIPVKDENGRELRPEGDVGVVVHDAGSGASPLRIRFADGETVMMRNEDLDALKDRQRSALGEPPADDLFSFVIYRCVVGSRAFGLEEGSSDVDLRGIYLPPARLQWGLAGVPGIIERSGADECYWELERFLVLALKGNPNILEVLHSPLVEHCDPIAAELLSIRRCFLSRFIHQTYKGYVLSQFRKLRRGLESERGVKWKHAMHLIRLLISGTEALKTGELAVEVGEHRERLLAIKHGELAWEKVDAWRLDLQRAFDEASVDSPLPERPDYARANAYLIAARQSRVEQP